MEETRISIFLADYDLQVDQIKKIYERLGAKHESLTKKHRSPERVESCGYWLHNLYYVYT